MGFYISVDSSAEKPTLGLANSSSSSMMGFVFTSKTPEFGAVFSGNCVLARSQGAATVTTKFLQRFPGIQGTLGVLKPGLCVVGIWHCRCGVTELPHSISRAGSALKTPRWAFIYSHFFHLLGLQRVFSYGKMEFGVQALAHKGKREFWTGQNSAAKSQDKAGQDGLLLVLFSFHRQEGSGVREEQVLLQGGGKKEFFCAQLCIPAIPDLPPRNNSQTKRNHSLL